MNILLNGYFDKNFGDDVMHKVIVANFPEHEFYISCREREMVSHLEGLENVHINEQQPKIELYLNVIGTGFMYKGKRAKIEKILTSLTSRKKHYPKAALINCSLETFDSKTAERFAKHDLSEYDLITCRDDETFEYLEKNFKNKHIKFAEDMVFSSSLEKVVSDTGKDLLGVAPVRRLYSDDNYDYYKELSAFCDSYVEKHNKNVLIFAFDSGLENDISAALSVKGMMKNKNRAEIVMYDGDIDEFAKNIGRCGLFVTSRFHGMILATLCGIKSVAISDREKLNRFCKKHNVPYIAKKEFTAQKLNVCINEYKNTDRDFSSSLGHISALKDFLSE